MDLAMTWECLQMTAVKGNARIIQKKRKGQRGMAIVETVPLILIFITLTGFTLGFYGVTQRMILSSIAARAYGHELIRNRTNINYLRDVGSTGSIHSYHRTKSRLFAARSSSGGANDFIAEKMPIQFPPRGPSGLGSEDAHNTSAYEDLSRGALQNRRNTRHLFDQVWIKNSYGICIDAGCGE